MALQILTSKKGTHVVTATNLHMVLQLPNHHYATNVRKWLADVYQFHDGIRKPEHLKDYAPRKIKDAPVVKDYYLSVELAKLITLNSNSKVKQKYARQLLSLEDKVSNAELLTKEQVLKVLELTKAMGLVSCQEACERRHLQTYEQRNGGQANNWWKHRASILGYSADVLRSQLRRIGKNGRGKSQREMLMQVDRYEMVRTAVIDLFMGMGKSERYARNLGDLAKAFARELGVEIFDDRNGGNVFAPKVNPEVVDQVRAFDKKGSLSIWHN